MRKTLLALTLGSMIGCAQMPAVIHAATAPTPATTTPATEAPAKETAAAETPAKQAPVAEVPAKDATAKETPAKDSVAATTPPAKDNIAAATPPAKDSTAATTPPAEDASAQPVSDPSGDKPVSRPGPGRRPRPWCLKNGHRVRCEAVRPASR
jgi:hypothetical protein